MKINIICKIGKNLQKEIFTHKPVIYVELATHCSSFWQVISIFSSDGHLLKEAELYDIILKGNHQRTIPDKFSLNWFNMFRGEDLSVIFFITNMPNLYNRYTSTDRNTSMKNRNIYMLKYPLYIYLKIILFFIFSFVVCLLNLYFSCAFST